MSPQMKKYDQNNFPRFERIKKKFLKIKKKQLK
jgi:hypothetical protein